MECPPPQDSLLLNWWNYDRVWQNWINKRQILHFWQWNWLIFHQDVKYISEFFIKSNIIWSKWQKILKSTYSINNTPPIVQLMAWRRKASSHYLKRSWPSLPFINASLGLNELIMMIKYIHNNTKLKFAKFLFHTWFRCFVHIILALYSRFSCSFVYQIIVILFPLGRRSLILIYSKVIQFRNKRTKLGITNLHDSNNTIDNVSIWHQLIQAWWRLYVSVNQVIIGSGNGLTYVR